MSRVKDLTLDNPYGRLIALYYMGLIKGKPHWWCRCICGKELAVRGDMLRCGNTRSCGCLKMDVVTIHGHSQSRANKKSSRTYNSWQGMRDRCIKPDHFAYHRYGARGITVCVRWLTFTNFLADMGERPAGKTLDRIDNTGSYWCGHCEECVRLARPMNCRWATPKQQQRNRGVTRYLTCEGRTLCMAEWAEIKGIPYGVVQDRLKLGWGDERTLTTPYVPRRPKSR